MDFPLYIKDVWLFNEAIDFRKGKHGLLSYILKEKKAPNEGLYLFINKRKDKIKGLCWNKNGFLLLWKELKKGKFAFDLEAKKTVLSQKVIRQDKIWIFG